MALLYKDSLAPAWICRMEARATMTSRSPKRGAMGATTSLYPRILCLSAQALLGILVAYCSIMKLNTALLGLVMLGERPWIGLLRDSAWARSRENPRTSHGARSVASFGAQL